MSRSSRRRRARHRRDRVVGPRADDARIGVSPAHPRTSGAVGHRSSARRARRFRGACAPRRPRRADARRAVLPLARRHLGHLLLDALRRAADRGVRVRLLLDDNNTAGLDEILAALDAHKGIEVRLFNPFRRRRARWLDYLTDFSRLNRRMHNKSFTADDQVTIVGGRNVGDEYFGAGHDVLFVDLDVLAIGPAVSDVSRDFDRYWHSESAWPVSRVLSPASAASTAGVTAAAARKVSSPDAAAFVSAVERAPFVRDLMDGRLPFDWAPTLMLSDDPAKGLGRAPEDSLLWPRLRAIMSAAASELHLISAYLVPGAIGSGGLAALAKRGVKVSALTNSLEATDVAAVHAGYAKYRKPMLESGVALFEMKRVSSSPRSRRALMGSSRSSRSSLHAKTFAIDRSRTLHRLVQLRSAISPAEHGARIRDRQSGVGASIGRGICGRNPGALVQSPTRRGGAVGVDGIARRPRRRARPRTRHERRVAARCHCALGVADRVAALRSGVNDL